MEKTRNPRFTGVLIFAGLWNLCLATWALFFTDIFIQVLVLEAGPALPPLGWTIVGITGIMFIGLGDLLFTIPFIMYLRATRQFGWF